MHRAYCFADQAAPCAGYFAGDVLPCVCGVSGSLLPALCEVTIPAVPVRQWPPVETHALLLSA